MTIHPTRKMLTAPTSVGHDARRREAARAERGCQSEKVGDAGRMHEDEVAVGRTPLNSSAEAEK